MGLFLYAGFGRLVMEAMFAALFHEACHLLVLRLCRKQIYCIRVEVFGARICTEPLNDRQECACAVAGPVGNLLLSVCFFHAVPDFAVLNLAMAVCNLLPLYPLDGGRLLRTAMTAMFSPTVASKAVRWVSAFVSLAVMLCASCWCVHRQKGIAGMIFTAAVLIKLSSAAEREAC